MPLATLAEQSNASSPLPKTSPAATQKSSSVNYSLLVFPPEEEKENKTKQQKMLSVGFSGLQSHFSDAARPMSWEERPLSGTGILLEVEETMAKPFCSVRALNP